MPEARITWRDKQLNKRTVAMIQAAEKLARFQFTIMQGSYNSGGVTASAGTHDGGGAIDVAADQLNAAQRKAVVLALRQVGFAAWLRTPAQGNWPYHVHAIAVGDKDLSRGAAHQVAESGPRQSRCLGLWPAGLRPCDRCGVCDGCGS
ncbi:hypothetical protein EV643_1311 [Kribbella sp. VKM Ac-2527]|uniref:Uncharacterized protein n=1 Tax=Kribbella caucasensis TaxID=2512215 RepID=A0A4R6JGR1_9ACTN|nr:hypothetical protein [Kribbella sp. VKM Ac-2527]TDO33735.1 hypothetical protein EV643_1311 [Kribbella sp. VKM Ac-2527]